VLVDKKNLKDTRYRIWRAILLMEDAAWFLLRRKEDMSLGRVIIVKMSKITQNAKVFNGLGDKPHTPTSKQAVQQLGNRSICLW